MRAASLIAIVLAIGCTKKDNALPAEEWGAADYAAANIPAVDHPWTHQEYLGAAAVLTQLGADHPARLPRYEGARSGAVFARLLEMPAGDPDAAIAERFLPHIERYEQINALSKRYMSNALAPAPREWMELMGVLLRESIAMQPLVEPFLASFGPDDPKAAVRRGGFAKMRSGWGGMIQGGLMMAGDTRVSETDRIAMVTLIVHALPHLFPAIPAEKQAAIRELVGKLVTSLPAGKLQSTLVTAQDLIAPKGP